MQFATCTPGFSQTSVRAYKRSGIELTESESCLSYFAAFIRRKQELHFLIFKNRIAMGAAPSSSVQEVDPSSFAHSAVVDKKEKEGHSFRLHRVTSTRFEAVLHNPKYNPKALSLFRLEDRELAKEKYRNLCERLAPFYESSPKCYCAATLQELIACLDQNPDWSLSHVASHMGLTECLKHDQVAASVNTSTTDKKRTALHIASRSGKLEFVQGLMNSNAKLAKDALGNTPLHYAAEKYPEVLDTLLSTAQGVAQMVAYTGGQVKDIINARNSSNETALDVACRYSQDRGVKMLLEAGASVDEVQADNHALPIHTAMKSRSDRCAEILLEFHPEQLEAKDTKYGGSPLHWAKTKEGVSLLLKKGANIEAPNNDGETPLHIMTRRRRLGCVIVLISSGANIEARGKNGCTVLHVAAEIGDLDIVRALIVFGADVNATNTELQTPLHIVTAGKQMRWKEIVDALGLVGAGACHPVNKRCTLDCSKPYKGTCVIGDTPAAFGPKLQSYNEIIKFAAVVTAAGLGASQLGADKVDSGLKGPTKSVFKRIYGKEAVLAMDGGGIRGLILIQLLLALEEFTKQPIIRLFDWIGGTSTGGILALAIAHGKSTRYCQGLYFKLKDLVFTGTRPYNSEPLERLMKQEFGEQTVMTNIKHPRVLVTAVLVDRRPASLYFFRNYELPEDSAPSKTAFAAPPKPFEQQVWRAARGTGAAPTFFRAMNRFLDGGLIANNPTLDIITEIHKYNSVFGKPGGKQPCEIGIIVSLGTGVPPPEHVTSIDVFKPESVWDTANVFSGARALGALLVDQATATHGTVVERAKAWCEMIDVPYFRFSSPMSSDVGLDETDDRILVKMLWETRVYVFQNFQEFRNVATRLTK